MRYLSKSGQKEVKKWGTIALVSLALFATVTCILLLVNIFHPFINVEQAVESTTETTKAAIRMLR